MKRRVLLAATATFLSTPLVGCLQENGESGDDGSSNGDGRNRNGEDDASGSGDESGNDNGGENDANGTDEPQEYETCHLVSIDYEWLPEEIRAEVDAALEEGSYRSDRLLFAEAVDPDRSYLVVDGTPYEPIVEADGDREILEFREDDVVRAPEPRAVHVRNDDTRDHELRVELTGEGPILEETLEIEAGGERELEATEEFGTYELSARALTGHEAEDSIEFEVSDSTWDAYVEVTDDDLWVSQDVADIAPCPWDDTEFGTRD